MTSARTVEIVKLVITEIFSSLLIIDSSKLSDSNLWIVIELLKTAFQVDL